MICKVCNQQVHFYEPYEVIEGKRVHARCYQIDPLTTIRKQILDDINVERDRQNKLHPETLALPMRFVTIMEEAGEVAEAMQDKDMNAVYEELIDMAASCVRMAEEVLEGDSN